MADFYCIVDKIIDKRHELLKNACDKRNIPFVIIETASFDFSQKMPLEPTDMLYRANRGRQATTVEKFILQSNCKTLYSSILRARSTIPEYITQQFDPKTHFIPTIPIFTHNHDLLEKYAAALGGFPVIIKVEGGTKGVGIIKVDSLASLISTTDYLLDQPGLNESTRLLLKKYIPHKEQGRLVVLGNKVIASKANYSDAKSKHEFRLNLNGMFHGEPKIYSDEIQQTAIYATHQWNMEFGGVDVLVSEDGSYYISEINFPCGFVETQEVSGVDIAGEIVDYLVNKPVSTN